MTYLDNAATTKPKREVLDIMHIYNQSKWQNPSSLYREGKIVKKDIKTAQKIIADFLGAERDEIYFTSGGSESNNWVLQGLVNQCRIDRVRPIIITSCIEHNSIRLCVEALKKQNVTVDIINVNAKGFINMTQLKERLEYWTSSDFFSPYRILVSIQYANNEIGTIQHITEIGSLCHKYGAILHTDAVQAFGKLAINTNDENIDLLSASGHKIGATKGVGFLYIRNEYSKFFTPLIYGTQNNNMRGGTENVAGIMGMAKAVQLRSDELLNKNSSYICNSEQFNAVRGILKSYKINAVINGDIFYGLRNIISLTLDHNVTGEALIYMLETDGYLISSGSACDLYSDKPSFVLKAIGLSDKDARRTIRLTLPDSFTLQDFSDFASALAKAIRTLES